MDGRCTQNQGRGAQVGAYHDTRERGGRVLAQQCTYLVQKAQGVGLGIGRSCVSWTMWGVYGRLADGLCFLSLAAAAFSSCAPFSLSHAFPHLRNLR